MDVMEKLVELLDRFIYDDLYSNNEIAEKLMANGVTVQDGKPLDAFLHPVDAYKGLKAKYLVFKADTGERVGNCFVLRPDKDPAAVEAIRAYARATDNETLAEDIYNWVGKGEPVQEWISVDDRLPEADVAVLARCFYHESWRTLVCYTSKRNAGEWYISAVGQWVQVTHWMPLPQPPKGE